MWEFLKKLFDVSDFPARWSCGRWTPGHGWLYILSDVAIFGAYTAIPILLAYFVVRRKDVPFHRVFWLFVAFILACGFTHLLDAVLFWHPMYRLSAVARLVTALVSWTTVAALVPVIPVALTLRTPHTLEAEVTARTAELQETQRRLQETLDSLERRVAERTAALQTSNEDLQQFAYIVAHDLQEPMRMVASFTQLLQEDLGEKVVGDAAEYLRYTQEGALRMQAQLRAVLTYSRIQSHGQPFAPVALGDALQDALDTLRRPLQEHHAVLDMEPTPAAMPVVHGDLQQLGQVFVNLLHNALQFSRPGVLPHIRIRVRSQEEAWQISVEDNGVGFDVAHAERIFQIFQRLQPGRHLAGVGVGLAICRRIVSRHGGCIGVTSVPGEGSAFSFTLPFFPPPPH